MIAGVAKLIGLTAGTIVAAFVHGEVPGGKQKTPAEIIHEGLQATVDEVRPTLPQRFRRMALVDVRAVGTNITYTYKLDEGLVQSIHDFKARQKVIIEKVCGSKCEKLSRLVHRLHIAICPPAMKILYLSQFRVALSGDYSDSASRAVSELNESRGLR